MPEIGFRAHDHRSCIVSGLSVAEDLCLENRWQLTPVRRRVLEILLNEHRAMGAYEILEFLRAEGLGSQPPIAYRALDFLVKHGFAHRVERLNAFVACADPAVDHAPAFLICRSCDAVSEALAETSNGALNRAAKRAGFQIEQSVVEAEGLCPTCVEGAAQ